MLAKTRIRVEIPYGPIATLKRAEHLNFSSRPRNPRVNAYGDINHVRLVLWA